MRNRILHIGNIVKFDNTFTKVTGYTTIDYGIHAVLETKDGLTGAVPVTSIRWNGKQFIYKGEEEKNEENR